MTPDEAEAKITEATCIARERITVDVSNDSAVVIIGDYSFCPWSLRAIADVLDAVEGDVPDDEA